MGNALGYIVSAVQIVAGTVLTIVGAPQFGVPLIISGVGTALQTAFAPSPKSAEGFAGSDTYGFDHTNEAHDGAPVSILAGRHPSYPKLVSTYTQQDGDTQTVQLLYLLGSGGRYGISDLRRVWLNDQDSKAFSDVRIYWWPGTSPQGSTRTYQYPAGQGGAQAPSSPGAWTKISAPHNVGTTLKKGEAVTYETKDEVDEVAIVFVWQGGLYGIDLDGKDAGSIDPSSWYGTVEYQDAGSSTWVKTGSYSTTPGWDDGKGAVWTIKAKHRSALRRVMRIKFSSTKRRTIRITAAVENEQYEQQLDTYREPTWVRTEEIKNGSESYAGYAMLGVEAVASAQLSGGIPLVRAETDGWLCEPITGGGASAAAFSRNPVLILRELLLNPDDGLGDWFSSSDIDTTTWAAVKSACDVLWKDAYVSYRLDLVMDVAQPAQDWIQHILSTCRATMLESNGKILLYQDVARSSIRTFDARTNRTASNARILTLDDGRPDIVEREIPSSDRPTHTHVRYYDEREDWAQADVWEWKEFVSVDWSSGDPVIEADYDFPGITSNVQALRQAQYLMERARLRTSMIEFGIGPADFDLLPLDVVTVYADSPSIDGALYQVLTVSFDPHGLRGRVVALLYDADAYDDDYRVTPTTSAYLTRAEALKKARQIPAGITDMKVTVL